jgi:GTP:adenosylcobinamide-phosphate guanylyltransferase
MSQGEIMEEERKEFKYTIGNKVYFQRKLVLGQVNQLIKLTKDLSFPEETTVMSLVSALGEKVTEAVAIVLIPADVPHLKQKILDNVINDLESEMFPEQALEVVEDFFDCNQISSLLNRVGEVVKNVSEKIVDTKKMEQNNSASSLQVETPPKETT